MSSSVEPPAPDLLLSGGWYTTEELASLLRVDPSTLRRWRTGHRRQGPPHVSLSDRVTLYSAVDVERWLRERRVTSGPVV
ncbi:helix-turn-helix transcriptional regulator [Streptomyces sp. NPDC003860]